MKISQFAAVLIGLLLSACHSDIDDRRGAVHETCNADAQDCREGLVCERGRCADASSRTQYSCGDFCSNLEGCGITSDTCVTDCQFKIRDWSYAAEDYFTRCGAYSVECETADEGVDVETYFDICLVLMLTPQEPLRDCDAINEVATACNGGRSPDAMDACYYRAKVTEIFEWLQDPCEAELAANDCSGLATCFNEVFPSSSPMVFGE